MEIVLTAVLGYLAYRLVRYVRMKRYFGGEDFAQHKQELASVVAEHNEVAAYMAEIEAGGTFELGGTSTGTHAHLASSTNTSQWNYKRDRNVANYQARNVHNCSLQVVRNASADPIKYLMKYFNIKATEEHLAEVERLCETASRIEDTVENLRAREASIVDGFVPPKFIRKHYSKQLMAHAGVELSPITVTHPEYVFEYVSAGGNSAQRTTVTLNRATTDALIEVLGNKIRWRKSAAGQRSLMTARFRNYIKERDGYACKKCAVSVADEPHLLLEVDHIIPVSRGGLSQESNLQTLCWRCNRTKSNKIEIF